MLKSIQNKTITELANSRSSSFSVGLWAKVRLQEAGDEEGGAGRLTDSFLKLITQKTPDCLSEVPGAISPLSLAGPN